MAHFRIRTKLLLVLLFISSGLSCASLLIVRHTVQKHVTDRLAADLRDSVSAFQNEQRLRETGLTRSAKLLANLPSLKALMTTQDPVTIQDAAADFWKLSGSDLFILADRSGRVAALYARKSGVARPTAQQLFRSTIERGSTDWWFGDGHLYEVDLQPIYFGPENEHNELGTLAVGYEIDSAIAAEVGDVAGGQVAFSYGHRIVTSTLPLLQGQKLNDIFGSVPSAATVTPVGLKLGQERFLAGTVRLSAGIETGVQLTVLKSFDQATQFLASLNRLLVGLGAASLGIGAGLVLLISSTVTKPLSELVKGVHSLQRGDYSYPLLEKGSQEVAELTAAFRAMRDTLRKTQEDLVHAERMAMIGQMASSISHDMRHQLSAIFANAEFLCSTKLSDPERDELFQEIRTAVHDMTDLVDSMLEFSRTPKTLSPSYCSIEAIVDQAIREVKAHPEYRQRSFTVHSSAIHEGWFDARRLQRAFYNLLLNASEAITGKEGRVQVKVSELNGNLEVRVVDNGAGIPAAVRETIFNPFVGFGKEHGTGLGLTIAQKILRDHGGDVVLEATTPDGTAFLVVLPAQGAPNLEAVLHDQIRNSIRQQKPTA